MFEKKATARADEHGAQKEDVNRRLVLARAIEVAAVAPLAGLVVKNTLDHRNYSTINSDRALRGEAGASQQSANMSSRFAHLSDSLDQLQSAYRDAYLKTRIVPYVTTDGKGRMSVRTRTETYWDEEASVPGHETIDAWSNSVSSVQRKLSQLSSPDLISSSKVNQLLVEAKQAGTLSQIGGSVVLYGAQIAAVLGYEELLGLRQTDGDMREQHLESKEQVRRGFFKNVATALGLGAAIAVSGKINSRLASGDARMDKAIERATTQASAGNDAAFVGHFERSPKALISEIAKQREQIEGALAKGVAHKKVRTAMQRFQATAKVVEDALSADFSAGIFDEFADSCKSAIITRTINIARSGESSLGEFAVAIEGLAVGGVMTATIVSLEVADAHLATKNRPKGD